MIAFKWQYRIKSLNVYPGEIMLALLGNIKPREFGLDELL